jgi:hypothetical protein
VLYPVRVGLLAMAIVATAQGQDAPGPTAARPCPAIGPSIGLGSLKQGCSAQVQQEVSGASNSAAEAVATPATLWQIKSNINEGDAAYDSYDGFPYSFIRNNVQIDSRDSHNCTKDNCYTPPQPGMPDATYCGIRVVYTATGNAHDKVFTALNSSYWNFNENTVGKILTDGTNRFYNPRTGTYDPYIMYFGAQQLTKGGYICAHSGEGYATSTDGWNFTQASTTGPLLPGCDSVPCTNTDFLCSYFPCDPSPSKMWWTGSEMFAPMILQRDSGNLYAPILVLTVDFRNPCAIYDDCVNPSGLCWPDNPTNSGTATYVLKSSDGLNWSRDTDYNGNGEDGRISANGIDSTSPCYQSAWLFNVDLAYDPPHDDWYMTRSFADAKYPPASPYGTCSAGSLPDRIQLYKAHSNAGVFYGPWTLLFDGGCTNFEGAAALGFQPDAASIVHDGAGNVVFDTRGNVTLVMSTSSGSQGGCGVSAYPEHRVIVGP